jgi:isopenicillin-N epimerase
LRAEFLLRDDVVFLNHGSFGACPRVVFEAFQQTQRELETQPVEFLSRSLRDRLAGARAVLGAYVGVEPDDLVFIPNSTFGVNIVARSLRLERGDHVLACDHEYGGCDRTWRYVCEPAGVEYERVPVDPSSTGEVVEQIWRAVRPETRLIFLSHITSPTAVRLPVEAIVARAREAGIMTMIDGAHAPGQLPLALQDMGVDFYTGNCHKWLCSPKTAGFLYVRRPLQQLIEPLVVTWGWRADWANGLLFGDNAFLNYFQWLGTYEPSAILSVPRSIEFAARPEWKQALASARVLAQTSRRMLEQRLGQAALYGDEALVAPHMFAVRLPPCNPLEVQSRLYAEHRVEVVAHRAWRDEPLLRVSVAGYTTAEDIERLVSALDLILATRV